MSAVRSNLETAPNTVVVVDESFKAVMQEASGHGEALQVEINQRALMEAARDSGFGTEDVLSFSFVTHGVDPRITVVNNSSTFMGCTIPHNGEFLATRENAQMAIQGGILSTLLNLSVTSHETLPQGLINKINPPLSERIKRKAKIMGGAVTSMAASGVVLENAASASSLVIKSALIFTVGKVAYDELSERVKPATHKDDSLIGGYRLYVNFRIDDTQK